MLMLSYIQGTASLTMSTSSLRVQVEDTVSYGGTLVSLGSVMRDDRVTLAKGVACMLCVKQLTKRNERVTKGENILR